MNLFATNACTAASSSWLLKITVQSIESRTSASRVGACATLDRACNAFTGTLQCDLTPSYPNMPLRGSPELHRACQIYFGSHDRVYPGRVSNAVSVGLLAIPFFRMSTGNLTFL